MKKEIIEPKKQEIEESSIEHYYNYKSKPMVKIKGNFMGGGFNLSKNKVKAVLANLEDLKKFADGDFDKEILTLQENEVLKP